ncbi:hypothetical protein CEXT_110751 [Caerostris extrusa]|uniref:Uncharacterized protein n=1 Tax=Caerostris extrusa TaxID=172846 RepID=A0AAV4V1S0_CAEEX|nr:hypothetical protein CEXT_110751 [Caerostris extrusa]
MQLTALPFSITAYFPCTGCDSIFSFACFSKTIHCEGMIPWTTVMHFEEDSLTYTVYASSLVNRTLSSRTKENLVWHLTTEVEPKALMPMSGVATITL